MTELCSSSRPGVRSFDAGWLECASSVACGAPSVRAALAPPHPSPPIAPACLGVGEKARRGAAPTASSCVAKKTASATPCKRCRQRSIARSTCARANGTTLQIIRRAGALKFSPVVSDGVGCAVHADRQDLAEQVQPPPLPLPPLLSCEPSPLLFREPVLSQQCRPTSAPLHLHASVDRTRQRAVGILPSSSNATLSSSSLLLSLSLISSY